MKRTALITGICGQDGSYLAESLEADGYDVYGVCHKEHVHVATRRAISTSDIRDRTNVHELVRTAKPDECYHLAAYHRSSKINAIHLAVLNEDAEYINANIVATQGLLAALYLHAPACRVFLAGSCHMFGNPGTSPQNEDTPFNPTSMYGITKVAMMQLGRFYREQRGLFCATGILYNHESPRRGPSFITSQLAEAVVRLLRGNLDDILIGNLDAKVDWGFAGDYVRAMRLILSAREPSEFVISSGRLHTVGEFLQTAYTHAFGRVVKTNYDKVANLWDHVKETPNVYRPVSSASYFGDNAKLRTRLEWSPRIGFHQLVAMMVDRYLAIG